MDEPCALASYGAATGGMASVEDQPGSRAVCVSRTLSSGEAMPDQSAIGHSCAQPSHADDTVTMSRRTLKIVLSKVIRTHNRMPSAGLRDAISLLEGVISDGSQPDEPARPDDSTS